MCDVTLVADTINFSPHDSTIRRFFWSILGLCKFEKSLDSRMLGLDTDVIQKYGGKIIVSLFGIPCDVIRAMLAVEQNCAFGFVL